MRQRWWIPHGRNMDVKIITDDITGEEINGFAGFFFPLPLIAEYIYIYILEMEDEEARQPTMQQQEWVQLTAGRLITINHSCYICAHEVCSIILFIGWPFPNVQRGGHYIHGQYIHTSVNLKYVWHPLLAGTSRLLIGMFSPKIIISYLTFCHKIQSSSRSCRHTPQICTGFQIVYPVPAGKDRNSTKIQQTEL